MENWRDDAAGRRPAGSDGEYSGQGADRPGSGDADTQASRKPRIEVLREESTGATTPLPASAARHPRYNDVGGADRGTAYAAVDSMPHRKMRKGRWLLLLAAVLFLILVAALSSVIFSPGRDHIISEPKTARRSTVTGSLGGGPAGLSVDDAADTAAPTAIPAEALDDVPPSTTAAPAPARARAQNSDDERTIERPRAQRPAAEPGLHGLPAAPRTLPVAPEARDAPAAEPEPPLDNEDARPGEQGSALQAAREFYAALSMGDGAAASQYVIPSKRQSGPLSAGALTRFYGNLRRPMRLRRATAIDADAVRVTYDYVLLDGRLCPGQATVYVRQGFDRPLISSIRAQGPC